MADINLTPTPHNRAKYGDIARRCIMPGDPKRATWIANTFLTNPKLVTDVRGIVAYTGMYKNKHVTVMAHGMGIPSMCIYAHELYAFYGVQVIYRVGSCGVTKKSGCEVGDVVLAESGWSDTNSFKWTGVKEDKPHMFLPTKECVENIANTAKKYDITYHTLPVLSSNFFYNNISGKDLRKMTKCEIIEIESYGLFMCAKANHRKSACLLTVSDNIETGQQMTAEERETNFKAMIKLALEAIVREKI